jgi:DNA helicase HerA-like ATPase
VILGMIGSGKTGLAVVLIEEALLAGIPCLVLDPKGDMGNLLLAFPDLDAASFRRSWVNEGDARSEGLSVDDFAKKTATVWREGLQANGIGSDRIRALREAAEFAVYLEERKERLAGALQLARRRVEQLDAAARSHQSTELVAGAGAVLGALLGGRRNARSIASTIRGAASRRGVTVRAAERRRSAEERAQQKADELTELEQELLDEVAEIDARWQAKAGEIESISIRPEADDVRATELALVWVPMSQAIDPGRPRVDPA